MRMNKPAISLINDTAKDSSKTLPHNAEAEQAVLGCILKNNQRYDELGGRLQSKHFYVPYHQTLFEIMERLINSGREASPYTVFENLKNTPFAEEDSKALYDHLKEMFANAEYLVDLAKNAEIIATGYLKRELIRIGNDMVSQAPVQEEEEGTLGFVDQLNGELFQLAEQGNSATSTIRNLSQPLVNVINQARIVKEAGSNIIGVTSGYPDLNKVTGGLRKSDLIILAARPSMGKTAFVVNCAMHAARTKYQEKPHGGAVGIFSLEMPCEQLAGRILSSSAGINLQKMSTGDLTEHEFGRLASISNELSDYPIYIDDTPGLSLNALRSRARRMKRQFDIDVIIIDYLQLMRGNRKSSEGNRVQEISEISQGLKHIARELQVPVIALSQLSRAVEQRDNKRPMLSDLRESGSIEQDADIVMFLYREEYYLQQELGSMVEGEAAVDDKMAKLQDAFEQAKGKAELIVSKNRNGPIGNVKLQFNKELATFNSLAGDR